MVHTLDICLLFLLYASCIMAQHKPNRRLCVEEYASGDTNIEFGFPQAKEIRSVSIDNVGNPPDCLPGRGYGKTEKMVWVLAPCQAEITVCMELSSEPVGPWQRDPAFGIQEATKVAPGSTGVPNCIDEWVSGASDIEFRFPKAEAVVSVDMETRPGLTYCSKGKTFGFNNNFVWFREGCVGKATICYVVAAAPPAQNNPGIAAAPAAAEVNPIVEPTHVEMAPHEPVAVNLAPKEPVAVNLAATPVEATPTEQLPVHKAPVARQIPTILGQPTVAVPSPVFGVVSHVGVQNPLSTMIKNVAKIAEGFQAAQAAQAAQNAQAAKAAKEAEAAKAAKAVKAAQTVLTALAEKAVQAAQAPQVPQAPQAAHAGPAFGQTGGLHQPFPGTDPLTAHKHLMDLLHGTHVPAEPVCIDEWSSGKSRATFTSPDAKRVLEIDVTNIEVSGTCIEGVDYHIEGAKVLVDMPCQAEFEICFSAV